MQYVQPEQSVQSTEHRAWLSVVRCDRLARATAQASMWIVEARPGRTGLQAAQATLHAARIPAFAKLAFFYWYLLSPVTLRSHLFVLASCQTVAVTALTFLPLCVV